MMADKKDKIMADSGIGFWGVVGAIIIAVLALCFL